MIKQIQLRGISRTPSDRLSEDGGLSESLNMYLDTAENAPVLVPKDVTAELRLPADLQAEHIFIHKTANYENYICQSLSRIFAIVKGAEIDIVHTKASESLRDIDSIGNILIITTSTSVRYCLYKDKEYKYIGDKMPAPTIRFETEYNNNEYIPTSKLGGTIKLDRSGVKEGHTLISTFRKDIWDLATRGVSEDQDANEYIKTVNSELWTSIQNKKSTLHKWQLFCCPRFVRYAVRLYDGSYILHSVPFLLGAGANEWVSANGHMDELVSTITFHIANYYKASARLINWDIENWEDIIAGLDIFISTDITSPAINTSFETCTNGGGPIYFVGHKDSFNTVKEEVLSKNIFYRIASFGIRDLDKLKAGINLHENNFVGDTSLLVQQQTLTSDFQTNLTVIPSQTQTFNNRLIAKGAQTILPDAPHEMNGLVSYNNQKQYNYKFCFHIKKGKIEYEVYAKDTKGNYEFSSPKFLYNDPIYGDSYAYANPYAWIAFPDPDCYKVTIEGNYIGCIEIPMAQHPTLFCSYAYIGLGQSFLTYPEHQVNPISPNDRDNRYSSENKLLVSEPNNPFIFPAKGQFTFSSQILGIAAATTSLSQGQFGQFPLYVFTEDGIWAMETASDGSFVSQKPLSREVCVNPDSICSIDNAVVFVAAKGVMMIQGSQVMNISPYMNGRHYIPNESAVNLIKNQEGFEQLESAIVDEEPFMTFMKKTKVTYDYAGQRLIFIAEDEAYQYIYKIDTQTWHKVAFDEIDLNTPTNSYPECLVQASVSLNKPPIYIYAKSDPNISINTVESLLQDIPDKGPLRQAGIDLSIASNLHDFLSGKTYYVLVSEQGIADDIQNALGYWGYDIDFYYGSSYEITIEYTDPDYLVEMIRLAEDLSVGFNDFYASLPTPSTTPNLLTAAGWKEFAKTKKVIFKNSDKTNGILETLGPEGLVPKTIDIQRIPAQATHVYSLSTPLDVSTDQSTAKGILITRPFDLGEPDVYKSIKSIKIRGDFDKENVKYILQGSDNGRDFYTLTSLRGKSWKMFRIFILADLEPTERISWIDVDYEPRYQNKLR